ncbi:MAG: cell division protein FtsA, partial [Bacteroidales bacterium]|nr:cell division protein FtsA [Bacteroidales bacterium]
MDKQQIVVGLDIGTTKIACLIGVKDENKPGKIKIIGHGKVASVGVVHGMVKSIPKASDSIKHAVALAAEEAKCSVTEVFVGIAGQHIKTKKNRGQVSIPEGQDFIMESDVNRLIEDQTHVMLAPGDKIIHIFPQAFFVDEEEVENHDPLGYSGNQLAADFNIVTGNETNIKNILLSVKLAGLTVKGIVLEPIASSMAVLTRDDLEAGVALVDIGGGTTDIAIFDNGVINHTHVIPVAGKTITEDIKNGCSVLSETAERLKVQFGSCMPESVDDAVVTFPGYRGNPEREIELRTLANIIKHRTSDIIDLVNLEIVQTGLQKHLVAGIVLTG